MARASSTLGFRSILQRVVARKRVPASLTAAGARVTGRGIVTSPTRRPLLCGENQHQALRNNVVFVQERSFSGSQARGLHTKEMNDEQLSSLKVDQNRLMEDLHYTCHWGTGERWGEYVTYLLSFQTSSYSFLYYGILILVVLCLQSTNRNRHVSTRAL